MSSLERIASELQGKRNGAGWLVRCPAHADRNPSLSVDQAEDGRILVRCFAGCPQNSVIDSLRGMGLWPSTNASLAPNMRVLRSPQKRSDTAFDLGPSPAGMEAPKFEGPSWCYRDAMGAPLFYIERIDSSQGKVFRPHSWDRKTQAWVNRGWTTPRPLYGLELLALNPGAPVLVAEGEKATEAARKIVGDRFVVVTWPNGARAVSATDWSPLKGRKAMLWPDADPPGLEAAKAIAETLRALCPEVRIIDIDLQNPDAFTQNTGFDAADALALGWGYEDFRAWAEAKIRTVWKQVQFDSVADSVGLAETSRATGAKGICPTGIRFIDLATGGGIGKDDVMLLAGPTGAGKTEAALAIAGFNAERGRQVYYFALEAAEFEITNRLLYRELASLYFESVVYRQEMLGKKLNYADWLRGKYGSVLKDLETEASRLLREKHKNLHVYYRTRDFGLQQLKSQVEGIRERADLIALDHVHYVDLEGDNENRAMTELIKGIRDLALLCRKPFLVVAHIRKRDARFKTLLPDLEDIHGSSNLAKIATLAVVLAPCFDPSTKPGQFFTYMRVAKNRYAQERTRVAAVCTFDAFRNRYEDKFRPGRIMKDGAEFEPLKEDDIPHWLKDGPA